MKKTHHTKIHHSKHSSLTGRKKYGTVKVMSKPLLIALFAAAGLAIIVWSFYGVATRKAVLPPAEPQETSIPAEQMPKLQTIRGTVTEVRSGEISVQVQDYVEVVSLPKNVRVEKVVSGTLEAGDVKTATASVSDLRKGQEVVVVRATSENVTLSVLIVK